MGYPLIMRADMIQVLALPWSDQNLSQQMTYAKRRYLTYPSLTNAFLDIDCSGQPP